MRITLVEDNISLSKGITYRLEDAGHSVDAIANGDEAQDYLVADGADLVILDINLPGVNGLDLLSQMRKRGDARPVAWPQSSRRAQPQSQRDRRRGARG